MLGSGGGGGGVGSSGVTAPAAAGPTEGGSNSEAVAAAAAPSSIFGNLNNNNPGEDDKGTVDDGGSGGFGGNRWPRQETLALLKIRSDMEAVFREASVKGPLWEEVSRKLAELGYHRNAKKCKEKFENVYKYHKRTKDGRSGKQEGKSYRFFDQLEALEKIASPSSSSAAPPPPRPILTTTAPMAAAAPLPNTVPSSTVLSFAQNTANSPNLIQPQNPTIQPPPLPPPPIPPPIPPPQAPPQAAVNATTPPQNFPQNVSFPADLMMSNSTSSSTSSDMDLGGRRQKRRRKWKDFFERLMREVTEKQEEMQRKFLEAIEKKEQERMMREDAWKMQEINRINREREILAQERSSAAAKDAAVMAFLQKITEKQNYQNTPPQPTPSPPPSHQQQTPPPVPVPVSAPIPVPVPVSAPIPALQRATSAPRNNVVEQLPPPQGDNNELISSNSLMSPSRWPKVEIEALIKLRTNLDAKYQDNSPKGPLWEEISAAMKRLGYNRNAKRCKEKWENINKYFKKVKESNKKRPEDSKTCPYFAQLDALYRERNNKIGGASSEMTKAENSVPLMVRPEQQWPPAAGASGQENRDFAMEEMESEREDGDEEMEEDEGSDQFEVVASKPVSMGKTGE